MTCPVNVDYFLNMQDTKIVQFQHDMVFFFLFLFKM